MMAMFKLNAGLAFLIVVLLLFAVACPKDTQSDLEKSQSGASGTKAGETVDVTSQDKSGGWGTKPVQGVRTGEIGKSGITNQMAIVYFDFDRYNLRSDAISSLQNNVAWLKSNPSVKILIEGHCDERGTNEYNMALGLRRSNSCRSYLVSNGISRSRIQVISYGEERPVDRGHNEVAWAKNRRAEFVILGK